MRTLLVDGSALAYRSYYAFIRNPLKTSTGEETSLTYGFMNTLLRLLQRYAPEKAAVVFDAPGKTFRHDIDPQYKANRAAMPDEMRQQIPRLHEALDCLRIEVLELEGFEADDVLGSLARRFCQEDEEVLLLTGDKDFMQIVGDGIKLLRYRRSSSDLEEVGVEQVIADLGIRPRQVVDYMALMGDSVDNIPGVAGVGKKTAAKLIAEYGDLEGVFNNLNRLAPSLKDKLEVGRQSAFRSRELVRLQTDLSLDLAPEKLRWRKPDWPRVRRLLQELEFVQLERLLPQSISTAQVPPHEWLERLEDVDALIRRLRNEPQVALQVTFDVPDATSGEPFALALSTTGGRAWLIPLLDERQGLRSGVLPFAEEMQQSLSCSSVLRRVAGLWQGTGRRFIVHDVKNLAWFLASMGLEPPSDVFDTLLASYVLDSGSRLHSLAALAATYQKRSLGSFAQLFEARTRNPRLHDLPREKSGEFLALHVDTLASLPTTLEEALQREGLADLYYRLEMPLAGVLYEMERNGVRIDRGVLEVFSRELQDRLERLERRVVKLAGESFNLNSPKQLGEILFGKLALPHGRKTKTGWSTDMAVLERLASEHPMVPAILQHRQLHKLQSTYSEALPKLISKGTGRIHARFNQAVASTGRLSSSEPNLQNIPIRTEMGRRIRQAFVPEDDDHVLLSADYSQIELRIMAHLSQDESLLQAFREGLDVHLMTAARVHGCKPSEITASQRAAAKTVNFGVIYGMGARGLAGQLDISLEEAKEFIEEYFDNYPGVRRYTKEVIAQARMSGYVSTLQGRRLALPDISSQHPGRRSAAERLAINAPLQGSAADLIKLAMVRLDAARRDRGSNSRLILQVHDELLFEVPKDELPGWRDVVIHEMQSAMVLDVPIVVDVGLGSNWDEAHQ